MTPRLTALGRLFAATAAGLILLGAVFVAWPLFVLGGMVAASLLVMFVVSGRNALLFRDQRLKFAWWIDRGESTRLLVDRPFRIRLALRNYAQMDVANASVRLLGSAALEIDDVPPCSLARAEAREIEATVHARAAGRWHLHGIVMVIGDRFGLYEMEAYFPNPLALTVSPRPVLSGLRARLPDPLRLLDRHGPRRTRRRGQGLELREIRRYSAGDPFRHIAWKSSARANHLMVRQFEQETINSYQLLLDISPSMRHGARLGFSKLDAGINFCAALSLALLNRGDRVALKTFDLRVTQTVASGGGTPHGRHIDRALGEIYALADDDLTDMTDAELYTAVSRYLAYQEGIDCRLPKHKHNGANVIVGARGEHIDSASLLAMVRTLEPKLEQDPGHRKIVATDDNARTLRAFCRARGIELPYRAYSPFTDKVSGVMAALGEIDKRCGFVVLVSDLETDNEQEIIAAIRAARRRHKILVAMPSARPEAEQAQEEELRQIAMGARALRQTRTLSGTLKRMGVDVLHFGRAGVRAAPTPHKIPAPTPIRPSRGSRAHA